MKVLNTYASLVLCAVSCLSPHLQAEGINANLFTHFDYDSSDAADVMVWTISLGARNNDT
jgi:hypothetical protein